jgi:hypothetical protein
MESERRLWALTLKLSHVIGSDEDMKPLSSPSVLKRIRQQFKFVACHHLELSIFSRHHQQTAPINEIELQASRLTEKVLIIIKEKFS